MNNDRPPAGKVVTNYESTLLGISSIYDVINEHCDSMGLKCVLVSGGCRISRRRVLVHYRTKRARNF